MLALFHFLHMIAGVAYGGGTLLFVWAVAPALVGMEGDARLAHYKTLVRYAQPFMAVSAIIVLFGGIARGWASGAITGFGGLFRGYGLMVTLAFVVFMGWGAYDGLTRARFTGAIEANDTPALAAQVGPMRIVTSVAMLVLLGLMGAMRLGMY